MPRGVGRDAAPQLLLRELLDWVALRPRTYAETIEAWRSNCPRHPVLDDAFTDGLLRVADGHVALTARAHDLVLGGGPAVPSAPHG